MTKKRLGQLSWLKVEIEDLATRIHKIERALDGRTARIDGMGFLGGKTDLVGDLVPQLLDLRDRLAERRKAAMKECAYLQAFITSIDDSQTRLVFLLRYVDNLSWQQVAWKMGGNTADSVRMIHNRYLLRLKKQ